MAMRYKVMYKTDEMGFDAKTKEDLVVADSFDSDDDSVTFWVHTTNGNKNYAVASYSKRLFVRVKQE